MKFSPPDLKSFPKRRVRGFTIIEIIICLVVVSAAFAGLFGFLSTLGASQADGMDRRKAVFAASELLEEIKSKKFDQLTYQNPTTGWSAIGLDTGETANNKAGYNDVDDYHGWSESMASPYSGFTRTATVTYVSSNSINTASASRLNDYKKVTVQVLKGNTVYAQLETVVSAAVKQT